MREALAAGLEGGGGIAAFGAGGTIVGDEIDPARTTSATVVGNRTVAGGELTLCALLCEADGDVDCPP